MSALLRLYMGLLSFTTVPTADIIVRKDGSGDHITVQAALDVVSAGETIEVQAASAGGGESFNEPLTFSTNGTDGNEITLRARAGDTIVLYATTGSQYCIELVTNSYLIFNGLQFGRNELLNGWNYSTNTSTGGRFAVEHKRWLQAETGISHHITFNRCTSYAGSFFDGGEVDADCPHFGYFDHIFRFAGVNGAGVPDIGGNNLTHRGPHAVFIRCDANHGGHDNLTINSPYVVIRHCILDGSWTDFDLVNPGRGNRAFTCEGSEGTSPYGPNLIEGNIFRGADDDLANDEQSGGTFYSFSVILRDNYLFDNEGPAFQMNILNAAGVAAADNWFVYNNTIDNCRWGVSQTDINIGSSADDHYIDHRWKNNIFSDLGSGRPADSSHVRYVNSNSAKRSGDPDDWRKAEFENNIFHTASADTFKARLLGDGGSNVENTLTKVEAKWGLVFLSNSTAAPTYKSEGNRNGTSYSDIIAAFQLESGSEGEGTAVALTLANGEGVASASLTVDESRYFYAGADPNTFDLAYFNEVGDLIQIGSNTPVQITAIDYSTHVLTLASAQSWSDNDEIFRADASQKFDNQGASQ